MQGVSLFTTPAGIAVALALAGLVLGEQPSEVSPEIPALRIMSFNIRYDTPSDGENGWAQRKEKVASLIRFHQADLVGVQEALKNQIADLAEALPDYAWVGVGRDDGGERGEFVPIFYRRARLELVKHGAFWLSDKPDVPGSMGWDAAITRVVTWAELKDRRAGHTFHHFNTHFDHVGAQARKESAKLLVREINQIAGVRPLVVTIDLNALEEHSPYRILTAADEQASSNPTTATGRAHSLADARYRSLHGHHGPTTTWNGFLEPAKDMKIDYIFVGADTQVVQHGVLADHWDGRFASDHFPVLAEVILAH